MWISKIAIVCLVFESNSQNYDIMRNVNYTFDKDILQEIEKSTEDRELLDAVDFALDHATLFNFTTTDKLSLRALYIPPPSNASNHEIRIIVFSVGWTETFMKYLETFRYFSLKGYHIFAFDIRGQGFSEETSYNLGPVTHVDAFQSYIDDLTLFVREVIFNYLKPSFGGSCNKYIHRSAEQENDQTCRDCAIYYVGNSLSGLIGIYAQSQNPHLFDRLILMAPCLKPLLPYGAYYAAKLIRAIGEV